MAAIPGLGGEVATQELNITVKPRQRFRCSDEMKASAVLLTTLGNVCPTFINLKAT